MDKGNHDACNPDLPTRGITDQTSPYNQQNAIITYRYGRVRPRLAIDQIGLETVITLSIDMAAK